MSSDIAIKVEGLSKCYQIYDQPRDRLKQFVLPKLQRVVGAKPKQYYKEFWALKDVSFEVKKGETIGIIGRNGSGKSTLLQMICGTLHPTGGSIQTYGRIAALLELGSGFNPEFTGRENVYMNGAVLGLSHEEIDQRYDAIASFADIGDFIDQPVKTYSSGMMVRLAFAVSIKVDPTLMIVDEALSVGDMNFQAKCMTALTRLQDNGATVVFVSHDVGAVKSLCRQAVYLERGQLKAIGKAPEIAEQYVRAMREEMSADVRAHSRVSAAIPKSKPVSAEATPINESPDFIFKRSDEFDKRVAEHRYGSGGVRITYVELVDEEGNPVQVVAFNQVICIRIYVEAKSAREISINFQIRDDKKINIVGCGFAQVGQETIKTTEGQRYIAVYTLRLPLQEGSYSVMAQISEPIIIGKTANFVDVVEDAVVFRMNLWDESPIWSKVHVFPSLIVGLQNKVDGEVVGC